ncbi:hypothetical protein T12_13018 [Trichinella patagoniensis]|uniref:Uncharacterized protein n=1 Tax=Trichinella patagoniensis TaxID=990121 RepID=A0A0V0YVI0_9BILA|nr:hypothetical protein T12_13018 [Trichinella patagoniensis]
MLFLQYLEKYTIGELGTKLIVFSYIPILFLEKNRFYENFEISWAIDCCFRALGEK